VIKPADYDIGSGSLASIVGREFSARATDPRTFSANIDTRFEPLVELRGKMVERLAGDGDPHVLDQLLIVMDVVQGIQASA